jgi:hypothetical protein
MADEGSELVHDNVVVYVRTICGSELANDEGVKIANCDNYGCVFISDGDVEQLLGGQNELYRVQSHLRANDLVERPGTMRFRSGEHAIHCDYRAAIVVHSPPRTRC